MRSLRALADDLEAGRITGRRLVETYLERIADPRGEGPRAFIAVFAEAARLTADWADAMRRAGATVPRFSGIPISVKACFDVGGAVTTCGSAVLADAAPAKTDAEAVRRLRAAGFVVIGHTNMTEFAYSAIGSNAVHGTPACAWDRARHRIPGGSSSGAAISVTDGMAAAALGSDSGGSCRIPAALNGLVGFKATAGRMPTDGANVMTPSLDSVGSLAASVECAAVLDAVLAGRPPAVLAPRRLAGIRLAIPVPVATEALDGPIAGAFEAACDTLVRLGVRIEEISLPELSDLPRINAKGGFSAPEYYVWHRELIARHAARYEPRILRLILRGELQTAADYLDLIRERRALTETVRARAAEYDALLLPTVPAVAPPIDALDEDGAYTDTNLRLLRNTRLANFLGGCAITLPCQRAGDMPVGLMLQAPADADETLLAIAAAVEAAVAPSLHHYE
jgi:aspartyl-tRNA(Asn)/glutamyl-tRNA(Gln) amidotransferase subunit A